MKNILNIKYLNLIKCVSRENIFDCRHCQLSNYLERKENMIVKNVIVHVTTVNVLININ